MLRYACHLAFIFVVYDVIYKDKIAIDYNFLVKSDI